MKNVNVLLVFCVLFAPVSTTALPLDETVEAVADCLVDNQSSNGAF